MRIHAAMAEKITAMALRGHCTKGNLLFQGTNGAEGKRRCYEGDCL